MNLKPWASSVGPRFQVLLKLGQLVNVFGVVAQPAEPGEQLGLVARLAVDGRGDHKVDERQALSEEPAAGMKQGLEPRQVEVVVLLYQLARETLKCNNT